MVSASQTVEFEPGSMSLVERFAYTLANSTNEQLASMAMTSPAVHFASCVVIQNKENVEINPVPNILQLRMSEAYEVCQALGVPCRMIVCKPRQVGCSTFGSHIVYHHGMRNRTTGLTISDLARNSAKLMDKVRDYGRCDRFPWGHRMVKDTAAGLRWTNGTEWEIDSAENPKAGIGVTRQAFHASEVGKWPKTGVKNDKRVMSAVLPSLSKGASVVIAESTPDGAVGWMYETWTQAVTIERFLELKESGRDGGMVWIKVFAAWFEFEEHKRPVGASEIEMIQRSMNDREQVGIERYGWTWEQIAWRRDQIRTECGGSEDTFDEYYPEDDQRCWAVSGRPRFNMSALMAMEARARGVQFESGLLTLQDNGSVAWAGRSDGLGEVRVWEGPREGYRYLVGCDPATGESQTTGKDPDRSSIQVWRQAYYDADTGIERRAKLVARVAGPFFGDGDVVAGHIVRLSRWYGGALVVPEVNMGLHVVEHLKESGVPLYRRIVPSARIGSTVEQIGFKLTDREQRRSIVEALATAIREDQLEVYCLDWIREAKAFITTNGGRDEARAGEHDDDILCGGMCWYALPSATEYRRSVRRKRKPRDWNSWKRVGDGSGMR
jgi:hypothetical protein